MGMFEWVNPTREALQKYLRGRTDFAAELPGALYSLATDPKARRSALERAPKPFQMTDADMDVAMSFWNPAGMLGKIVYHGSPHKFDKFDASKIGTGEGAQAYGHGVYLADKSGVAKDYANKLGTMEWKRAGAEASYDPMTLDLIKRELQKGQSVDDVLAMYKQYADAASPSVMKDMHNALKSGDVGFGGSLYKADLPDEWIPKMLDWDKPLAEQAPAVRAALQKLGELMPDSKLRKGSGAMGLAESRLGSKAAAAQALREAGIPGIRYLDGGSRGAGQGSYNYVVFPGLEDQVKILERNGIPLEGMFKMDKK